MDPTITAAWISGGIGAVGILGTAVTAWIGSRSTRKATEQAIAAGAANTMATLAAPREDRLWEKRCAVYEETITGLMHRQAKRQDELRLYKLEGDPEPSRDFFVGYDPPGWLEAQGRLISYASDAVLLAGTTCQNADLDAWRLYEQWRAMADRNKALAEAGDPWEASDAETMLKARRELNFALQTADEFDQVLLTLIRAELRSRPEAATLPADGRGARRASRAPAPP